MVGATVGGIPTWDLETIHWVVPIAVGFFDGYNYQEFMKENEDDDVLWRFLSHLGNKYQGMRLYAHYASKFDNKFVLASLCKHGEAVRLEAGYLRLRWLGPNIVFEDSFPVVPMSLDKMNKMFGVEEKKKWTHTKTLPPWEMKELPAFREYLRTDCMSLSHSLFKLCEMLGMAFGQVPSISLSTTAAKVFDKCFYSVDDIEPNEEFEEFIRGAIYGGRNEVYKRYGENINMYDIHWMYTSCYNTPVPIGKLRWVKANIDRGTLVEATVKVPKDWYIGPLPKKVNGRLIFPVGEFTGWWDIRELRNAIDMGVDITIRRQLYCEEETILEPFGTFVDNLKKKGKPSFWKMFGLSLSGKFGQSRWRDTIKHVSEVKDMRGYTPLDEQEEYFSVKEYMGKGAPYIRPLISMRIRAEARIRHLKVLTEAMKKGEIFYGDTDSVFTTSSLPEGENIGDLVNLGQAERGYFIRQKLYGIIMKGKFKQKSAGYSDLKLNEENFKELLGNNHIDVNFSCLPSYRKTLSTKEVTLLELGRVIKGDMGDSRISEGENTRPIYLQGK